MQNTLKKPDSCNYCPTRMHSAGAAAAAAVRQQCSQNLLNSNGMRARGSEHHTTSLLSGTTSKSRQVHNRATSTEHNRHKANSGDNGQPCEIAKERLCKPQFFCMAAPLHDTHTQDRVPGCRLLMAPQKHRCRKYLPNKTHTCAQYNSAYATVEI